MCKEDSKIHFCTCSKKEEVNIEFADEVMKLYNTKWSEAFQAVLNEDGEYYNTYFKWTLSSFEEEIDSRRVMGSITYPNEQLNTLITIDNILDKLNNDDCFDFEYKPKEKDFFEIIEKYVFIEIKDNPRDFIDNYMSFKFEDGKWIFGKFPMNYIHEAIEMGKVKALDDTDS